MVYPLIRHGRQWNGRLAFMQGGRRDQTEIQVIDNKVSLRRVIPQIIGFHLCLLPPGYSIEQVVDCRDAFSFQAGH